MKIAFINEYHPLDFPGGTTHSLQVQKDLLEKNGHSVKLITLQAVKHFYGTIKFFHLNLPLSPFIIMNPFTIFYLTCSFINSFKNYDLIHVHGKYMLPPAWLAAKWCRKPIIVTIRDYKILCPYGYCIQHQGFACNWIRIWLKDLPEYIKNFSIPIWIIPFQLIGTLNGSLASFILKWLANRCHGVIYISEFIQIIFKKNGLITNSEVIYNLPPKLPNSINISKRRKATKPLVLMVSASLSKGKGMDLFLQSAQLLKDQADFWVIGKITKQTPLDNQSVKYLGKLSYTKVLETMEISDIVVVPSVWPEPHGRVPMEAMALSKPVIVTNAGGLKESVIDQETGFIVNPDSKSIVKALVKLIKDQKLRIKMGKKGNAYLNNKYNPEKQINRLISYYEEKIK